MKLNQTMKRIVCLALSIMLLLGTATPVFAATNETKKRDIIAEIIASIDLTSKRVEKKVVNHLDENMNPSMVEAEDILAATDRDVQEAIDLIEKVIVDAEGRLKVGTTDSADSYALLTDIVKAQESVKKIYETAEKDLATAKANLEAAQKAYDEAVAIATNGGKEAAAQLAAAKEAVEVAEKAFDEVNNKLVMLEELVASAAEDTNAWKAEAQNALAAAGAHLAESNAQLDEALATLETENAEFVATVEAFQAQNEVFVAAINKLADKVEVAQEKEDALYALYAEYEAVLVAYENAMAAFETEHGVTGITYEDACAIMEGLSDAVTTAQENVRLAEVAVTDAQAVIDAVNKNIEDTKANITAAQDELDAVKALINTVVNGAEDESAAAVHTLAGLVIENQLANGLTVVWQEPIGKAARNSYGQSETGFYVILNADGSVNRRCGYALEDGVVNIYLMKSTDVTNYVTYRNVEYALDEEQMTLPVAGTFEDGHSTDGKVYGDVTTGYYVVENWTEGREDVYGHQVVELTDLAPNALALSYEGYSLDLASLTNNGDGTYSAEVLVVKLVVSKNTDATWTARVHTREYNCGQTHVSYDWVSTGFLQGYWKETVGECSLLRGCAYTYVPTETVLPVAVSYPDKTQISYNNAWVDLATAEDGSLYIPTADGNVSLVANTNAFGKVESYVHPYTVDCSANVGLGYRAGGDADTFFEFGTKLDVSSNTLLALKESVLATYNTELENYLAALEEAETAKTNADNDLAAKRDALAVAETKYNNAQANFDALTAANGAFAEKDLGTLANLPKNFAEFITSANLDSLEDITALVEAITVISNDNADAKAKLNAFVTLTQFIPMSDLVIPENYEEMNIWEYAKFLYEFIKTDLGKALLDTNSFQHAYLMAWIDALTAKVEVLMAGIEVVTEAEKTITSGLEIIYAGAELSDASIETMIEKIRNEVLSGAVAALTIAVDVVEVSDEMVKAINEELVILRFEAATAKAEVDAAKAELEALQLQTPGGEALAEASERLERATEKYDALVEDVDSLEDSLADAEEYRKQAQARYEELKAEEDAFNAPASPEEGVLPTPGVDYEEPTQEVVVVLPDGTEVSLEIIVGEEEQVPEEFEVDGVAYRFVRWRTILSESGEEIGVVAEYEVVEEPEVPETPVEPEQPEVPETPVEPEAPVVPAPAPVVSEQTETTIPFVFFAQEETPVVEEVEEVVENVATNNEITIEEEVVEIEDEETPLADGVTDIVEEEVPLAANKEEEPAVAPVAAVAGTATVAAAGFVGFLFFRRKKSL